MQKFCWINRSICMGFSQIPDSKGRAQRDTSTGDHADVRSRTTKHFDATIEAPITIRDPDKRIGTHVFTAMARGDSGLRWSAVTFDDADGAKAALDRIAIPKDILDRIGPAAMPRSSIIVSDEPLSKETNYRTEFVAVLNNHPQGGFITRKPTPRIEAPVERYDSFWGGGGFGFFERDPPSQIGSGNARPRGGGKQGWM